MTVTERQERALIRAAAMLGRFGHVLAEFEAGLVRECVERFRDRGDKATLTANEWRVVEESLAGMDAAREDAERADAEASAGMRGAA